MPCPMGRGVGERLDDLELLDHRTRPAVRDDQWQRVFMLGPDVDEVDVQPVDFGDEVRYGVEPLLDLAPVILGLPVAQNLLDGLERHALREIGDRLLLRQAGFARRRRRSARAASGMLMRNGWMASVVMGRSLIEFAWLHFRADQGLRPRGPENHPLWVVSSPVKFLPMRSVGRCPRSGQEGWWKERHDSVAHDPSALV